MRRAAAALVAAVLLTGLVACDRPEPQDTALEAIKRVAEAMDKQPVAQSRLVYTPLPVAPSLDQVAEFLDSTIDSEIRWQAYMASLGASRADWALIQLRRDTKSATAETQCFERNTPASTTVSASLSPPLFCPRDQQGTLYLPIDSVREMWLRATHPAVAVQTAMYVWMTAQWADGYMVQIRRYATQQIGAAAMPDPHADAFWDSLYPKVYHFSWCIAGTLAKAAGLVGETVKNSLVVIYGSDSGMSLREFRRSLAVGYDSGLPGECVRQFWPNR